MKNQPGLDQICINTLRPLSIDAVQKPPSGHPGMPMDVAPAADCLWQRFLRYDPADLCWPNRDRPHYASASWCGRRASRGIRLGALHRHGWRYHWPA